MGSARYVSLGRSHLFPIVLFLCADSLGGPRACAASWEVLWILRVLRNAGGVRDVRRPVSRDRFRSGNIRSWEARVHCRLCSSRGHGSMRSSARYLPKVGRWWLTSRWFRLAQAKHLCSRHSGGVDMTSAIKQKMSLIGAALAQQREAAQMQRESALREELAQSRSELALLATRDTFRPLSPGLRSTVLDYFRALSKQPTASALKFRISGSDSQKRSAFARGTAAELAT